MALRVEKIVRADSYEQGFAKGMQEGGEEAKKAMARKLLGKGLRGEELSDLTHLSIPDIQMLISS